jgi:CRP-like cAMP-binding protein
MNNIEILKNCFLFKDIENNIFEACCGFEGYYSETYAPSSVLQNSNTDKKIGIIIKGKAVITSSEDGVIIKKLGNNDIYGVAILYDSTKYLTQVKAISECKVLILEKLFVDKCISYNSKIAMNYITFLANKIGFLNSKISSFTAKSIENKLMTYLLQLPNTDGFVHLTADYSTIAKSLGIGRASLYRAFDKLEKDGQIIKNDKNILIKEV